MFTSATTRKKRKKSFEDTFKPEPYQVQATKFIVRKPESGLFLAPGLGKTVVILWAFHILKRKGVVDKLLVVSTKRIIYLVWPKEIEKWNLPYSYAIVHGSPKKRADAWAKDVDIYLLSFGGLVWLAVQSVASKKRFNKGMLAVDESSKVKTFTAQRTEALKKVLQFFKRRHILSGSPTPNSMLDLFAQVFVLDMGATFGKFIGAFKNTYFYVSGYKNKELALMEGAEETIYRKIKHLVIRFSEDLLDLPPLIPLRRTVELPPDARKQYWEMEQDFITFMETGEVITAANGGVASMKCRQIANGSVYLPDFVDPNDENAKAKKVWEPLHAAKIDELVDLVDELRGMPAIIGYEFDHDRQRIQEAFPDVTIVDGKTSDKQAVKINDAWNRGEITLLAAQTSSVSHGLNLQETKAAIVFYSLGWNMDDHYQFIRRVWRKGQKYKVLLYFIMAEDTIDDAIVSVLESKHANQERLFRALETRYEVNLRRKKERKTMPTKKKAKHAAKKAASKKRAAKKKTTAKKAAPKRVRDKDGLLKNGSEAKVLAMIRRKTGASVGAICGRLNMKPATVRVTVRNLRGKDFKIRTGDDGKYHIG
jgi:DNA-binding NarL/FixJ family response regulator